MMTLNEMNVLIDEERKKYVMPNYPEMKKGVRFMSNHRVVDLVFGKKEEHLKTDIKMAFHKLCELDYHYSNKEKWA